MIKNTKTKEEIERVLDSIDIMPAKNNREAYQLWTSTNWAVQSRAAYEAIKVFESNPKKVIEYYGLKKSYDGLGLNLARISKDIWVPKRAYNEGWNNEQLPFEIFAGDEYNIFFGKKGWNEAKEKEVVYKVLYPHRYKFGDKLDLFLNDASWRESAKEYSFLALNTLKETANEVILSEDKKIDEYFVERKSKKGEECLNTICKIADLYLNEMK